MNRHNLVPSIILCICVLGILALVSTAVLITVPRTQDPTPVESEPTPATEKANLTYTEEDLAPGGNPEHSTIEGEVGIFSQPKVIKWSGEDYYLSYTTCLGETPNLATILKEGKVAWQYKCTSEIDNPFSITDITLKPNSVILLVQYWGVYEVDYKGNCIYGLPIDGLTHQAELLPNGNFLLVRTNYDQAFEITREGKIVWEWSALHQIKDYGPETYSHWEWGGVQNFHNPCATHREGSPDNPVVWTHINSAQKLEDGYLLTLRNLDLVVKLNSDNEVVWSFGPLILKHPHWARLLENGNLVVLDNGNGRAVEFTPSGEVVFEYSGLNSPALGLCQKLWNGNYLITDTMGHRILEVTPEGKTVKEIHTTDLLFRAKAYNGVLNND